MIHEKKIHRFLRNLSCHLRRYQTLSLTIELCLNLNKKLLTFEPFLKGCGAIFAITPGSVAPAPLIINLPAEYVGVMAKSLGHGRYDLLAVIVVCWAGWAVVPARPMVATTTGEINPQNIRMILSKPDRGCGRRGAQHHPQASAAQFIDCSL